MKLPKSPEGYQWRIRRVHLLGYTSNYLAITLEPTAWLRRLLEDSYTSRTFAVETVTDHDFETAASKLLDEHRRTIYTESDKVKKYIGTYGGGDEGK